MAPFAVDLDGIMNEGQEDLMALRTLSTKLKALEKRISPIVHQKVWEVYSVSSDGTVSATPDSVIYWPPLKEPLPKDNS